MSSVPHPIPYQGSKRRLAESILQFAPKRVERLIEPFAGSAAITIAAAQRGLASQYILGERLEPLAKLWKKILAQPEGVADRYEAIWESQLPNPKEYYFETRAKFNTTGDPILLLYLLARCVKNAVRFNPKGEFNQSPDNRRLGMRPDKMRTEILGAAALLSASSEVVAGDYRELLGRATRNDLVYMDPPYQGVSTGKDNRYAAQIDFKAFVEDLQDLNRRRVPYLLSFDGYCGSRSYGEEIPESLGTKRVLIDAGRSSQATLTGRNERTMESLYIAPSLIKTLGAIPTKIFVNRGQPQLALTL